MPDPVDAGVIEKTHDAGASDGAAVDGEVGDDGSDGSDGDLADASIDSPPDAAVVPPDAPIDARPDAAPT